MVMRAAKNHFKPIMWLYVWCIDPEGRGASLPSVDAGSAAQRSERAALDLRLSNPRIPCTTVRARPSNPG